MQHATALHILLKQLYILYCISATSSLVIVMHPQQSTHVRHAVYVATSVSYHVEYFRTHACIHCANDAMFQYLRSYASPICRIPAICISHHVRQCRIVHQKATNGGCHSGALTHHSMDMLVHADETYKHQGAFRAFTIFWSEAAAAA